MKIKYVLLTIGLILAAVLISGCLDVNPTPTTQTPVVNTSDENKVNNVPVKYSKMEGSFTLTSTDFSTNKSKTISKDNKGNTIKWDVEENNTGGIIQITYFEQEVSAYIPRLYYPENKTYSYSIDQNGYKISHGTGGRYESVVIKGEWAL